MARPIPVLNVYYMFCYAWEAFEHGAELATAAVDAATLLDLVAHVMDAGVRRLMRRGLDQGYTERTEPLGALRGTIRVGASIPLLARRSPMLVCRYDERAPDVPHNRVVKAALARLWATDGLNPAIAARLGNLLPTLSGITDVPLRPEAFRQVQLYRHNAAYAFLIHLARLVMQSAIPEPGGSEARFRDVANDEGSMRRVFEAFVRNLLAREQRTFAVSSPRLDWDAGPGPGSGMLPGMRLDILLVGAARRVIIDTKYTVASTQSHYDRESMRSAHLYQLFAYLVNAESTIGHAEGILLYPADGAAREYEEMLRGHRVRVATVDLTQPWPDVRRALLALAA